MMKDESNHANSKPETEDRGKAIPLVSFSGKCKSYKYLID